MILVQALDFIMTCLFEGILSFLLEFVLLQVACIDLLMSLGLGQSEETCLSPSQLKHSIFFPLKYPLSFSLEDFSFFFSFS